jgi:hypothetical protein
VIKKILRTGLPVLLAFAAGWAVQTYGLERGAKTTKAPERARGQYASPTKVSPFSANYANAVHGQDTAPKLVAWSADSALGKILATTQGGQRTLAIAGLIAQTPADQLGFLLNSARLCNDSDARDELQSMAYAKWADADPEKALAFARAATKISDKKDTSALTDVLSTWAGHDPAAALAAVQGLDTNSFRQAGIQSVLANWASDDPAAALAAAKSLNLGAQLNPDLDAIYTSWAQRDPAAAFAALDQVANVNARNNLAGTILQTMADSDPNGALKLLLTLPEGAQNAPPYPVNSIFSRLAMQDPAAAVQSLSQLQGGAMRERAITCIADDWADADPANAISWANSLSNPADRDNALLNAVRHVSGQDPVAAANDLSLIPDVNQRNQAMSEVLGHWTDSDPAAALKWVQNNTSGNAQTMALTQIVQGVADTDPMGAMAVVQQMPDNPSRDNLLFQTIGQWSDADPAAAMQWAKTNLSGADQTTATTIALNGLIQTDPAAGGEMVAAMSDTPDRNNLINQVANAMAGEDMDSAIAWINSVPNLSDQTKDGALQNVLSQLTQSDPAAAAQKLQSLNLDPSVGANANLIQNLSGRIADSWAQGDPDAALAWSENLTDPARQNALNATLNTVASADPVNAWNTVANLTADDPDRASLMNTVVADWGRSDPAAAVSVLGYLTPAQQNNAINTISRGWVQQDPTAASTWINTLPVGTSRDRAVQNLISSGQAGSYDLSTGMAWASSISTPAAQTNAYQTVILQTARSDPAAAQAAVNAATLTDAQRAQLTQFIQTQSAVLNGKGGAGNNPGPPPQGYHYEYSNGSQQLVPN